MRLTSNDPGARYLKQFLKRLKFLELNEIRVPHTDLIMKFLWLNITSNEKLVLDELRCNVCYPDSAIPSFQPDYLKPLRALFDKLVKKPSFMEKYPKIFFHGIQLDFKLSFNDHQFAPTSPENERVHLLDDTFHRQQVTKCSNLHPMVDFATGPYAMLLSRYPNIRTVSLNRPIDDRLFLNFLKQLDSLVDHLNLNDGRSLKVIDSTAIARDRTTCAARSTTCRSPRRC